MVLCSSNLVLIIPQPFLTPVPPIGSEILAKIAFPFGYIIGSLRTVLILALGLAYVALVQCVCLALVKYHVSFIKSASTHVIRLLFLHYTD
jgi:hypothetical protein